MLKRVLETSQQVLKRAGESVTVVFSESIVCMMSQNKVKSGNTKRLSIYSRGHPSVFPPKGPVRDVHALGSEQPSVFIGSCFPVSIDCLR